MIDGIRRSFKITPRKQNAHAYVNAAFKFNLDASFTVTETPSVVFGGYGADLGGLLVKVSMVSWCSFCFANWQIELGNCSLHLKRVAAV